MSLSKIVVALTGSISCYKACTLISRLRQAGKEIRVIATPSALRFVGEATLEGLSGFPVQTEVFSKGTMMDHIQLVDWCDAAIFYPTSADTINRLSVGLAGSLPDAFFLAFDWKKPLFLAPSMNHRMLENPITQSSLEKLQAMGVRILPPEEGFLACGAIGAGRVYDPEQAVEELLSLSQLPRKKILLTGGGTKEPIDSVRSLTNSSTGKTATRLATLLAKRGHHVTLLRADSSAYQEKQGYTVHSFTTYDDLAALLQKEAQEGNYDCIVHAAAVGDFAIQSIHNGDKVLSLGEQEKIDSTASLSIALSPRSKLINQIRSKWGFKGCLIAFKLTVGADAELIQQKVQKLFSDAHASYVVHNDLNNIHSSKHPFSLYCKHGQELSVDSVQELAAEIENVLIKGEKR